MTKTHNVIKIDDYYVVVEKSKPACGDTFLIGNITATNHTFKKITDENLEGCVKLWETMNSERHEQIVKGKVKNLKVVATIGKRIEGIPLIEIPDKAVDLALKSWGKLTNKGLNEFAETVDYMVGFVDGYKAANKGYSEEDIRIAFQDGMDFRTDTTEFGSEIIPVKKGRLENLFKLLRPQIKSVELEYNVFVGTNANMSAELIALEGLNTTVLESLKITNPSTNTINPVNIVL